MTLRAWDLALGVDFFLDLDFDFPRWRERPGASTWTGTTVELIPDQLPAALPVTVPLPLYVTLNDQPLLFPAEKAPPPFVGFPEAVIVARFEVTLPLTPVRVVVPESAPVDALSLTPVDAVTLVMEFSAGKRLGAGHPAGIGGALEAMDSRKS